MRDLHGHLVNALAGVRGDFAWVVEDPATGVRSTNQPDVPFPGASTLKVAVLVRLLQLAESGTIHLDACLRLREWHKCGGAGVLQYFANDTMLRVDDLTTLMIVLSDNTATNLLLDLTGCAPASATIGDGRSAIRRYYGKPAMSVPDDQPYTALVTAEAALASSTAEVNTLAARHAHQAAAVEEATRLLTVAGEEPSTPESLREALAGLDRLAKQDASLQIGRAHV